MTPSIEFNNVYRHFKDQRVLKGLSFNVEPGRIYALLGRNGAGKTTALRILLGFLAPMHGYTTVLGKDSLALSPDDRGRIGYLGEGHKLYTTMKVSAALKFEAGTRPRFNLAYAEKAIARCGLPKDKYIRRLSRGQRAQLSLIFAVAGEPDVLICDDPAMGLDVVMRREFLDAMIDLLSGQGCSVLFSSHILTDVERIADRIGILHDGRLIVDADMEDLKRRVQKCHWTPGDGGDKTHPSVKGILRARPVQEGYDLTLLDMDDARQASLSNNGAHLGEAKVPSLEELFLDLTTGPEGVPSLTTTDETEEIQ